MDGKKKFDLEERLINFALMTLSEVDLLPESKICAHLGGQLLRSGTSAALNYGEVQAAESDKDFCHKLQVVLKELRETSITLKILSRRGNLQNEAVVQESKELVAIFAASVKTAKSRRS